MTVQQYCPDLEVWPERWKFDEHDIAPGQAIVEFFKPFMLSLLAKNLSLKTLRRDRDHLWLLGGELIRRRYDDPKLKKIPRTSLLIEVGSASKTPGSDNLISIPGNYWQFSQTLY